MKIISKVIRLDKTKKLQTHLLLGSAGSFTITLGTKTLALLISIVLARLLGTGGFGIYVYSLSIVTLLIMPAMQGLQQLIIREVAAYKTKQCWSLIRGLLRRANQVALFTSIVLMILAGGITQILSNNLDKQALYTFWLALFLLPLLSFTFIKEGALRGFYFIIQGQLPISIIRPGAFLFILVTLYLWQKRDFSPIGAMGVQIAASATAFLVGMILLQKRLPSQVKRVAPKFETRCWASSAMSFLFLGGMNIINGQIDTLMIGPLLGAESVGIYRVAERGAELVPFSLVAVNLAIAPAISSLYKKGEIQKLQRIITSSARAILLYSIPVATGLIIFGPLIIEFMFGQEFSPAFTPFAILCIAQLINTATGSVGLLLNMTGYERDTAKAVAIAAILNILFNSLLIPILGVKGAAIATAISFLTWNLLLSIWVVRRIGIHTTALGRLSFIR